jgi:hypothetical protein
MPAKWRRKRPLTSRSFTRCKHGDTELPIELDLEEQAHFAARREASRRIALDLRHGARFTVSGAQRLTWVLARIACSVSSAGHKFRTWRESQRSRRCDWPDHQSEATQFGSEGRSAFELFDSMSAAPQGKRNTAIATKTVRTNPTNSGQGIPDADLPSSLSRTPIG